MRNKLGKPGKGRSVTTTLEEWIGPCFIKKKETRFESLSFKYCKLYYTCLESVVCIA